MVSPDTPVTMLLSEFSDWLRRAHAGEDPDLLLVEFGANAHYIEGES